jgi:hypothetical protein
MDINEFSQKYGGSGKAGGVSSLDSFVQKHGTKDYYSSYQIRKNKKQELFYQQQA